MAGANSLAYFDRETITVVECFVVQNPGANVIKILMAIVDCFS
jgi:hypothetical protein